MMRAGPASGFEGKLSPDRLAGTCDAGRLKLGRQRAAAGLFPKSDEFAESPLAEFRMAASSGEWWRTAVFSFCSARARSPARVAFYSY